MKAGWKTERNCQHLEAYLDGTFLSGSTLTFPVASRTVLGRRTTIADLWQIGYSWAERERLARRPEARKRGRSSFE